MTFGQKPVIDTKTEVSFRSEMGFKKFFMFKKKES